MSHGDQAEAASRGGGAVQSPHETGQDLPTIDRPVASQPCSDTASEQFKLMPIKCSKKLTTTPSLSEHAAGGFDDVNGPDVVVSRPFVVEVGEVAGGAPVGDTDIVVAGTASSHPVRQASYPATSFIATHPQWQKLLPPSAARSQPAQHAWSMLYVSALLERYTLHDARQAMSFVPAAGTPAAQDRSALCLSPTTGSEIVSAQLSRARWHAHAYLLAETSIAKAASTTGVASSIRHAAPCIMPYSCAPPQQMSSVEAEASAFDDKRYLWIPDDKDAFRLASIQSSKGNSFVVKVEETGEVSASPLLCLLPRSNNTP